MRVSSVPVPSVPFPASAQPSASVYPQRTAAQRAPFFAPFGPDAFAQARIRRLPVFLVIGDVSGLSMDSSLSMLLTERTVPVHLRPGERPDVELLCQRAGALFSGEGALPLCALLTCDARPFLAAPLPPEGFPADPSRLFAWLSHADRRFSQNPSALAGQAAQVIRSFRVPRHAKPYSPGDAAHDLTRAMLAIEDKEHGGFGGAKMPLVSLLRHAQSAAQRGDPSMQTALSRTLDAMLSSALYDPLDGGFFRAALTEDWRVFIPVKPLGINAMLASVMLDSGRRSEAIRTLNLICDTFLLPGGGFSPALMAMRSAYALPVKQVCAALGSENGLRLCRLLGLLHRYGKAEPAVFPSRFSPSSEPLPGRKSRSDPGQEEAPRCPVMPAVITPEDAAFLRRVTPALLRARTARSPQKPLGYVVTEHCALAAAVLAEAGRRLGEKRYTQTAGEAVSFLTARLAAPFHLPASVYPASPLSMQCVCGASAALSLALLTLAQGEDTYAQAGLRLLNASLHAFVREDGLVMHTQKDAAAYCPRVPAVCDGELPSPASLLIRSLRAAGRLQPHAHYGEAIETIWSAAAPTVRAQPLACASLIDAAYEA